MKKRKNIKRKNTRRKSGNTRLKRKIRITKRVKCILAVLCAVLLVVATAFAIAQGNKPRRLPNVLLNMNKDVVFGVDLSHFNGEVDFEALKSEVDFVILRVGYTGYSNGKINADDKFKEYAKAANDVGLPVGVYYYSQATNKPEAKAEAKAEATNNTLNSIKNLMKNTHWSAEKAMEAIGIPKSDYTQYLALL